MRSVALLPSVAVCSHTQGGSRPLTEAVFRQHLDVVRFLACEAKADLDARDQKVRSALLLVCYWG